MGKVTIRGVSINYSSIGKGEDVVLIHGLAANQGFWSPAVLMPLVRKYKVTLLDLRGHGHSSMPGEGYSSRELAGDLLALLKYIGVEKATLIGHSFGGVVALHTAVLYPGIVKRLVLADTRIRAFQPHLCSREVLGNKKFAAKLAVLGLELPENEQETGLWLLEQFAEPKWREKKELLQRAGIFTPFGGWNGNRSCQAAERWLELMHNTTAKQDFQEIAGLTRETIVTVNKPILALCGGNSSAVQTLEALKATLPFCQTSIIPNAGHFFPLTHPQQFIAQVMGFLQFNQKSERRVHQRFVTNIPIRIQHNRIRANIARMRNASLEGMLLESDLQLTMGSEVKITCSLAESGKDIVFEGDIIRGIRKSKQELYIYGIRCTWQSDYSNDWEKFIQTLMMHPDMKYLKPSAGFFIKGS